jgi:hypothetical protein
MLTEKQAREKWCPHSRDSSTGGNRARFGAQEALQYEAEACADFPCIASACMAWRWAGWEIDPKSGRPIVSKPVAGYCGLAGEL